MANIKNPPVLRNRLRRKTPPRPGPYRAAPSSRTPGYRADALYPIDVDYSISGKQRLVCRQSGSSLAQGTVTRIFDPGYTAYDITGQIDYALQPAEINETVGNAFDVVLSETVSNLVVPGDAFRPDLDVRMVDINPGIVSTPATLKATTGVSYVKMLEEKYGYFAGAPVLAVNAITNGNHSQTLQYACLKAGDTAISLSSYETVTLQGREPLPPDDFRDIYSYVPLKVSGTRRFGRWSMPAWAHRWPVCRARRGQSQRLCRAGPQ